MNIQQFERNVEKLCKQKKITKGELAEKMNVKFASLSRALKGNPQFDTIIKIAEALQVPAAALFEEDHSIDGYVSVDGNLLHIHSLEELAAAIEEKSIFNVPIV